MVEMDRNLPFRAFICVEFERPSRYPFGTNFGHLCRAIHCYQERYDSVLC